MSNSMSLSSENVKKIPSKLFLLYISMASMIMFFSALSSALIVKRGDFKHWVDIPVPSVFFYSTIVIIISSWTLHLAKKYVNNKSKFKLYAYATLILGIAFIVLQYMGWIEMKSKGILLTGNPSGSYIYVISLLHGLHYVGGIIALLILIIKYRKINLTDENKLSFKVLTQYWHFIGIIWVYLYLLFKFLIYK